MAKTIRVGVITESGGAHLGQYFAALNECPEVEAVALADPSQQSVDRARKALGKKKLLEPFKDAGTMLRDVAPQAALISVEAVHGPAAIALALDAGCHVLAEKPACTRAADFAPLVRKAEEKHRHLLLALANRSHPSVREARRLLHAGTLGKVYGIELHIVADQTRLKDPAYRKRWEANKARAGGGFVSWLGIHWLDLALYVTGLRVRQVAGFAGVVGGQPLDVEDAAAMALQFDNGAFGSLTAGYFLDKSYHTHLQVWAEHGWLRLKVFENAHLEWYSPRLGKDVQIFQPPKFDRGYTPFVQEWTKACAGDAPSPLTGAECLHVLETIFAFYDAAGDGRARKVT
jgi:predicted dehydrogenase